MLYGFQVRPLAQVDSRGFEPLVSAWPVYPFSVNAFYWRKCENNIQAALGSSYDCISDLTNKRVIANAASILPPQRRPSDVVRLGFRARLRAQHSLCCSSVCKQTKLRALSFHSFYYNIHYLFWCFVACFYDQLCFPFLVKIIKPVDILPCLFFNLFLGLYCF